MLHYRKVSFFKPKVPVAVEPRITVSEAHSALVECKYNQAKAAKQLGCTKDELWSVISSTDFLLYVREIATLQMLALVESRGVEIPKNIAALAFIRDTSECAKERISAVRALGEIYAKVELPAMQTDESLSSAPDKMVAVERIRDILSRSGPIVRE